MKCISTLLITTAATLTLDMSTAYAWGQNGHRITAEIGERNLNSKSHQVLQSLIGNERWPNWRLGQMIFARTAVGIFLSLGISLHRR